MMTGYFAALAARVLAETECRLQREEVARQNVAQVELHHHLTRQDHQHHQGDVIDVQAREVPDVQALPAPQDRTIRRGDIVRQEVKGTGRHDYFHVERVHSNGALDCIADADGRPCGLSLNAGGIEKTTAAELMKGRRTTERDTNE